MGQYPTVHAMLQNGSHKICRMVFRPGLLRHVSAAANVGYRGLPTDLERIPPLTSLPALNVALLNSPTSDAEICVLAFFEPSLPDLNHVLHLVGADVFLEFPLAQLGNPLLLAVAGQSCCANRQRGMNSRRQEIVLELHDTHGFLQGFVFNPVQLVYCVVYLAPWLRSRGTRNASHCG
jgi:hypothetical protein